MFVYAAAVPQLLHLLEVGFDEWPSRVHHEIDDRSADEEIVTVPLSVIPRPADVHRERSIRLFEHEETALALGHVEDAVYDSVENVGEVEGGSE